MSIQGTQTSCSMADVARQAGVTKTTVSMIFRNKPGISQATRRRVLEAASELNYQYGADGTGYRGQIGLMFISGARPEISRQGGCDYLHRIVDGCVEAASRLGSSVVLSQLTIDEIDQGILPPPLERGSLDGMLIRGWLPLHLQQALDRARMPYVIIDGNREVLGCAQIQIANAGAMDEIVDHLVGRGVQRIATITGDMDHYDERDHLNAQERHAGLLMALGRRKLAMPDNAVVFERGFTEESGRRGVAALLERGARFEAIVCHSDRVAIGAIEALNKAGLKVPGDVRVTGFDNMQFAKMCAVPLTTVDPNLHDMGELAVTQLLSRVQGKPERVQSLHIKVPAELIVRESA